MGQIGIEKWFKIYKDNIDRNENVHVQIRKTELTGLLSHLKIPSLDELMGLLGIQEHASLVNNKGRFQTFSQEANRVGRPVLADGEQSHFIEVNVAALLRSILVMSQPGDVFDKLKFAFTVYDDDQDGYLTRFNLSQMMIGSVAESSFQLSPAEYSDAVNHMFAKLDRDGDGKINLNDLFASWNPELGRFVHADFNTAAELEASEPLLQISVPITDDVDVSVTTTIVSPQTDASPVVRANQPKYFRNGQPRTIFTGGKPDPVQLGIRSIQPVNPRESRATLEGYEKVQGGRKRSRLSSLVAFTVSLGYDLRLHWPQYLSYILLIAASVGFFCMNYFARWTPPASLTIWSSETVRISFGLAGTLSFQCSFLLLTTVKWLLAWLQRIGWTRWVPLLGSDLPAHVILSFSIVVLSLVHAGMFLAGPFYRATQLQPSEIAQLGPLYPGQFEEIPAMWEMLFTTVSGITGLLMIVILLVICIGSMKAIREKHYEAFLWTHRLYVLFLVLLVVHGLQRWLAKPIAWMFILGPIAAYLVEQLYNLLVNFRRARIEQIAIRPSNVFVLVLSKPAGYKYRPGQYVAIKVPSVSQHQWHPFMIMSFPHEPSLRLYVSACGDWTWALFLKLKKLISAAALSQEDVGEWFHVTPEGISPQRAEFSFSPGLPPTPAVPDFSIESPLPPPSADESTSPRWTTVIDKPAALPSPSPGYLKKEGYEFRSRMMSGLSQPVPEVLIRAAEGRSSQRVHEYDHAVLICTGRAATSFIAAMPEILEQLRNVTARHRHVDFYWINRSHEELRWLTMMIHDLQLYANSDGRHGDLGQLRAHLFFTRANQKHDLRSFLLCQALDIRDEANIGVPSDALMIAHNYWGRPDWNGIFDRTRREFLERAETKKPSSLGAQAAQPRIGVFFAGRRSLGRDVYGLSKEYSTEDVQFDFYENEF